MTFIFIMKFFPLEQDMVCTLSPMHTVYVIYVGYPSQCSVCENSWTSQHVYSALIKLTYRYSSITDNMDLPALACKALKLMMGNKKEFETIGDVGEQLRYVEKRLKEQGLDIEETVDLWKRNPSEKGDCIRSQKLRKEGNKLYQNNQIGLAKELYRYSWHWIWNTKFPLLDEINFIAWRMLISIFGEKQLTKKLKLLLY